MGLDPTQHPNCSTRHLIFLFNLTGKLTLMRHHRMTIQSINVKIKILNIKRLITNLPSHGSLVSNFRTIFTNFSTSEPLTCWFPLYSKDLNTSISLFSLSLLISFPYYVLNNNRLKIAHLLS